MIERIICADAVVGLAQIESGTVDMCVTSPPYYGLRDYGISGQIGLEETPDEYITRLVSVFREVRRVLRDDGTLWVNIGDSYAGGGNARGQNAPLFAKQASNKGATGQLSNHAKNIKPSAIGCKPKDLIGIPWMLAFALRADGWYLRNDIIWNKPNPMPESVTDRCSKSHEYIFMFSKEQHYYFDHIAIKEPVAEETIARQQRAISGDHKYVDGCGGQKKQTINQPRPNVKYATDQHGQRPNTKELRRAAGLPDPDYEMRNKRSVWTVSTKGFSGEHFACFPPDLIRPCILAGSRRGGAVLDTFFGAGTTGIVALEEMRGYIGIELNPEYADLAAKRIDEKMINYKLAL